MLLLGFFVQKVFSRQISVLGTKRNNPEKIKTPLFFLISYSLIPKIEICIKFFGQKFQKSSHSVTM
jgi:hypothetical protein